MNPFEYLNAINYTKQNIMVDDLAEKGYNPFMVNRSLSYQGIWQNWPPEATREVLC